MAQNTKSIGVLERIGKTLQEFAFFFISPWRYRATVKSLQKRVDFLERRLYEMPNTEERLESIIQHLQSQLNFLQDSKKNRLDNLLESDLRQQVLDVLKEETYLISKIIKPTVEVLINELEDKKQVRQGSASAADVRVREEELQESIAQIQQLTASLPQLEAQTAACLEAGHWLLAHRAELVEHVGDELLSPQHPQIEEFRYNLGKYLKLLGGCLENGIEPCLLYQGVITHHQPPVEIYMKAFKLIRDKHISDWESSYQLSTQAAEQLRAYFSYLIDYLVKALL